MDVVSEVLVARSQSADGLNSMVGISVIAHVVVLAAVVLVPADWWGVTTKEPETILQVSLGGPEGPRDGGLATLGGRPIQQAVPIEPKRPVEPVRPPAARQPEMVEPTKKPPIKATPNKIDAKDPRSRTPTKGAEVQKGTTVAETGKGQGFGLGRGQFAFHPHHIQFGDVAGLLAPLRQTQGVLIGRDRFKHQGTFGVDGPQGEVGLRSLGLRQQTRALQQRLPQ